MDEARYQAVITKHAMKIAQLETDKAFLETDNENLRSQLQGLTNRVAKLEENNGSDLSEGSVATSQQYPVRAEDRSSTTSDLAHDGGISQVNGGDVPEVGVQRN